MYSKQQVSQVRHEFWTTFGRYMTPVLSAEGEKINWVNYKTGEKHVNFRMDADNRSASIAIEITHPDPVVQQLFYEHFAQLKHVLHKELGEEWQWKLHITDEHEKSMSRIYKEIEDVNIFRKEDWPALISFFKERMVALDAFWSNVKYGFEVLR